MYFGMDKLADITQMEEWKRAYSAAIEQLDLLYQEENRLYYSTYAQGIQSERLREIMSVKHNLMTNESIALELESKKKTFEKDSIWNRRLEVFLSKMKQESLDSQDELVAVQHMLQSELLESSFTVNGKEYNLGSVHSTIMEDPDRELRKRLFKEAKKVGARNETLFRELIQIRNQLAKELGYQNYYHFRCSLQEMDMEAYIDEMNDLLESARDRSDYWDDRIKEKFGYKEIHQYDQYFSVFNYQESSEADLFKAERIKEVFFGTLASFGLSMDDLPLSVECLEIPYGGFCINIHPTDTRVVVNKRDAYSVYVSGLHELGHAIDGVYSSYQYPELYRFYSSIAAEGVAELFQTIATDKEFLMKHFKLDETTVNQLLEQKELMDIKMVKMNFYYSLVEYELYTNPERNFQEVANECYKEVFGAEGEAFHPASEMFYIENPAFFQDYNMALAIREMILSAFKITSPYGKPEIIQQLVEKYLEPNQLYTWQERVNRLCSEEFTFRYLKRVLGKGKRNG